MSDVPREKNNQVSGINNFVRNIGGSVGIALITTLLTRQAQKHVVYMSARTGVGTPVFNQMTNGLTQTFAQHGAAHPQQLAWGRISGLVGAQATTLAYVDIITGLALLVACLVPLVMIMRRPKPGDAPQPVH